MPFGQPVVVTAKILGILANVASPWRKRPRISLLGSMNEPFQAASWSIQPPADRFAAIPRTAWQIGLWSRRAATCRPNATEMGTS